MPSVVRWRTAAGAARFCAVRGGVFTVSMGHRVSVASREAIIGESLETLEARVRAVRAQQLEADRHAQVEQTRLHALAVRELMRYLRPEATS
jgi:F-type H+-transporting ATPase subunit epsilon